MYEKNYLIQNDFAEFRDFFIEHSNGFSYLRKDTYISNACTSLNQIYYIIEGRFLHVFLGKNGFEKTVNVFGKNTIAPLYTPLNYPIEDLMAVRTLDDCEVIGFSRQKFAQLLELNPALQNQLNLSYVHFINLLLYENMSLINDSGLVRISHFLSSYLREHPSSQNIIQISQQDLGNVVGLNLINTSRNLKILKDMGIISTGRNRITVLDPEKLKML